MANKQTQVEVKKKKMQKNQSKDSLLQVRASQEEQHRRATQNNIFHLEAIFYIRFLAGIFNIFGRKTALGTNRATKTKNTQQPNDIQDAVT